MELTLNPSAVTRRLRAAGVTVEQATRHTNYSVRVYCATELGARRAQGLLLQDGYDVGRARAALTVTVPESPEEAEARHAVNAEGRAAAAELADPTSEAGAKLDAALTAMNPAAAVHRDSSPAHDTVVGEPAACSVCQYTSGHWPYCQHATEPDVANLKARGDTWYADRMAQLGLPIPAGGEQ